MIPKTLIAKATIRINAPLPKVWNALITPATIKRYMFGTDVVSDFKKGSPIAWKGEWQGKSYEDKGVILEVVSKKLLQYTHFSPMTGLPDIPANYHTVTIELADERDSTLVSLSQDNNSTEKEKEHSEKNWAMMLSSMKKILET